jgi:hypothetical protein
LDNLLAVVLKVVTEVAAGIRARSGGTSGHVGTGVRQQDSRLDGSYPNGQTGAAVATNEPYVSGGLADNVHPGAATQVEGGRASGGNAGADDEYDGGGYGEGHAGEDATRGGCEAQSDSEGFGRGHRGQSTT